MEAVKNKHIIRYVKEHGKFPFFKKEIKTAHIIEKKLNYNAKERNNIFLVLSAVNSDLKNEITSYIINKNKDDAIKLFKSFLTYYNLYDEYYHNLDKSFIIEYAPRDKRLTRRMTEAMTPFEILTNSYAINLYITYAFSWDNTKERFKVWSMLNNKWCSFYYTHLINVLAQKKSFEEPLFKTDEEYVQFIAKTTKRQ